MTPSQFNIYCDESCHLENDQQRAMVLGAVWCPTDKVREIAEQLRRIKSRHDLPRWFEIKWSKVSPGRLAFYRDVLDYFFDDDDLRFRALIVPDKGLLRHDDHRQDHDTFYYKMYYTLLRAILSPDARYNIYLDIKDTRSHTKEEKLHDVLCNALFDRDREVVRKGSERPGDKGRIVIALADFTYIVVLADRGKYVILWTAYCVEQEHRRGKLRKEYERSRAPK